MFKRLVLWLVVAAAALGAGLGYVAWWQHQPLAWQTEAPPQEPLVDFRIPPGTSTQAVARALSAKGMNLPDSVATLWLRWSVRGNSVKAGDYEWVSPATPWEVVHMLMAGKIATRKVTLIEGWTWEQVKEALSQSPDLVDDVSKVNVSDLMAQLNRDGISLEGQFMPDTYFYNKGAQASGVLKQAAQAMDKALERAWGSRHDKSPLKSPYELLTLASLVEKETGDPKDRLMVASVFDNRLRIGMRLQTDPSVMYGVSPTFNGRLKKSHLTTDTPFNTYTRPGLPPTPIALPGEASLRAAARPAQSNALFFVSRGDGTSQFSRTLDEHNSAVQTYILNKP